MVADVMEADQEVAELEATEAEVEGQDVEAEHAALTAELQADAAHEFEWSVAAVPVGCVGLFPDRLVLM